MKCPKCSYLGFDTGQRCRNCGYDFSLMVAEEPAAELSLRIEDPSAGGDWRAAVDEALAPAPAASHPAAAPAPAASVAAALSFEPTMPPPSFRGEPALPLFGGTAGAEDEPLIKVPARPRPPLSVRRTPDTRLRPVTKPVERPAPSPELDFTDEPAPIPASGASVGPRSGRIVPGAVTPSTAGLRLLAALIDHAILLAIDATVLYLTLRVATLTLSEWTAVPVVPMAFFLGLLKLSYFTAFTCVGGQTIGKMATGIRVVGEDLRPLDPARAVRRAFAGTLSVLTLGAGFVLAFFEPEGRALHDRLAHTRVVTLPPA